MHKIRKLFNKIYRFVFIYPFYKANHKYFMPLYLRYLRKLGVQVGKAKYIDFTSWLDSDDYSLIIIEDDVVISREVNLLVHDYSITRALLANRVNLNEEYKINKPIHIGRNSFIGLRSILLPGTIIGENSIIGAGSVVRGVIEPYSIMIGNPAKKIGDVRNWANSKIEKDENIKIFLKSQCVK